MLKRKFLGLYSVISEIIGFSISSFFLKEIVYHPERGVKSGYITSSESGITYYYALINPSQRWLFWVGISFIVLGLLLALFKEILEIKR